jgi:hypothetical protein
MQFSQAVAAADKALAADMPLEARLTGKTNTE